MTTVAAALTRRFPDFNTGWSARVVPMHAQVTGRIAPALTLVGWAVACVLLIGCANVANLLLARGSARRRELAVRAALGADRGRLVRQLLGECLALSVAAGLAGWGLAAGGLLLIRRFVVSDAVPRLDEVTLDLRVVAFAMMASAGAALLAGLLPALSASRLALVDALKDGSRGQTSVSGARLRPILVALEVALAVVLMSGAGLLVRSLSRLVNVDPGFTAEGVATMRDQPFGTADTKRPRRGSRSSIGWSTRSRRCRESRQQARSATCRWSASARRPDSRWSAGPNLPPDRRRSLT